MRLGMQSLLELECVCLKHMESAQHTAGSEGSLSIWGGTARRCIMLKGDAGPRASNLLCRMVGDREE